MTSEEWSEVGEIRYPEEFKTLDRQRFGLPLKDWVLWHLTRKPAKNLRSHFISSLVSYAERRYPQEQITKERIVSVLKNLFNEGVQFCKVVKVPQSLRIRTPALIVSGTKERPFSNCMNCPAHNHCQIRGKKHGK